MDLIDKHILNRSTSAIRCLSLTSVFYEEIQISGLSAEEVFQMQEKYISNFMFKIKNPEKIEGDFLWLIKIGILRREVDGQGLTSKVRLTPLGRLILETDPTILNKKASLSELCKNWLFRNFHFL